MKETGKGVRWEQLKLTLELFALVFLFLVAACVFWVLRIANIGPPPLEGQKQFQSAIAPEMQFTKIDSIDAGPQFSLGIASNGVLFASYIKDRMLHLAKKQGSKWEFIQVPKAAISGVYMAMAVGPDDSVHLFSFKEDDGTLLHDVYAKGKWISEEVKVAVLGAHRAAPIDAKIDSLGKIVVSYVDFDANVIRLATKPSGGAWKAQELPVGSGQIYNIVSLRLDRNGDPVIAFSAGKAVWLGMLKDKWSYAQVDRFKSVYGGWPLLALGTEDSPALIYMSRKPKFQLWLARREGEKQSIRRVNQNDEVIIGVYTIASGNTGNVLIGYEAEVRRSPAHRLVLVEVGEPISRYSLFFEDSSTRTFPELRGSSIVQAANGDIHVLFAYIPNNDSNKWDLYEAVINNENEATP